MTDNRPRITDPGLLDLAAQGVDLSRMGSAYADRAYPKLDTVSPRDAYSLGFTDGVGIDPVSWTVRGLVRVGSS